SRFGQIHQQLKVLVVIQFTPLLGGRTRRLLRLKKIHGPLAHLCGWPKLGHLTRSASGDKFGDFSIRSHVGSLPFSASQGKAAEERRNEALADRKSTRLNSSHGSSSYAVFCLKKKKKKN